MSDDGAADLGERLRSADADDVAGVLAAVDSSDPEAVDGILEALQAIAAEFVLPARDLLSHDEEGWTYFDLDSLAGYEIPGLISGALETMFPALTPLPPDDVLAGRLEASGFDIDDADRRRRFYRGWMAVRAGFVLDGLIDVLARSVASLDDRQLKRLSGLVQLELAGRTRWRLVELLADASPVHARELLETIEAQYLRAALQPRDPDDTAST